MIKKNNGKEFELFVHGLVSRSSEPGTVKHNIRKQGKKTLDKKRQLDVIVINQFNPEFIERIYECKDHKEPLDVGPVEKCIGMFGDHDAKQNIIVSASGYTPLAINRAKPEGIALYRAFDSTGKQKKWRAKISVPVIVEILTVHSFQLCFESSNDSQVMLPLYLEDQLNLEVYKGNVLRGNLEDIIFHEINEISLGLNEQQSFSITPLKEQDTLLFCNHKFTIKVCVELVLEKRIYRGEVPIKTSGFHDVVNDAIITDQFKTENLDLETIVNFWSKIQDLSELDDLRGKTVIKTGFII